MDKYNPRDLMTSPIYPIHRRHPIHNKLYLIYIYIFSLTFHGWKLVPHSRTPYIYCILAGLLTVVRSSASSRNRFRKKVMALYINTLLLAMTCIM
ncbi:hypothetical protein L210DRAFT_910360, partial [Boletus edulis BED1]